MNTLWIFYSGLLMLLPLINTFYTIPSLDLNLTPANKICSENFPIVNNSLGEIDKTKILAACQEIERNISCDSQVFYLYDLRYYEDIRHYATSSTTIPVCSVEPATTDDVVIIIQVIRKYRVPFAVKSGGHILNPGFSSTTGVHIAMRRFCKTQYHADNQTVDVGAGLIWDDVYRALEPYNISVLGGRVSGIGVGGFILGGGYGWKSNQYGLAIDNVYEYELVTPSGTVVYVNNQSYPDIFFGLKGGFNNFGIVTKFNMRALPQTQVYGGLLIYAVLQFDSVLTAIKNFQNNTTDPRAAMLPSFTSMDGVLVLAIIVFYDAPTAPQNIFKEFMDIPHTGMLQTRSFLSLVQASPVITSENMRGRYNSVSVIKLTTRLLEKVKELSIYYSSTLLTMAGTFVVFTPEPFLSTYFDNSQDGAYPHTPSSTPLIPINIYFGWQLPVNDQFFINEIQCATNTLLQTALDDGQDVGGLKQIVYPNYALENTPLSKMYGDHVDRLKNIRQIWDPENITYLAGGFKF